MDVSGCLYGCMPVFLYACMYVFVHLFMYVFMYILVLMYRCISVSMYLSCHVREIRVSEPCSTAVSHVTMEHAAWLAPSVSNEIPILPPRALSIWGGK